MKVFGENRAVDGVDLVVRPGTVYGSRFVLPTIRPFRLADIAEAHEFGEHDRSRTKLVLTADRSVEDPRPV